MCPSRVHGFPRTKLCISRHLLANCLRLTPREWLPRCSLYGSSLATERGTKVEHRSGIDCANPSGRKGRTVRTRRLRMSGSQPLSQEEVRNIWSNIVEYVRRYNLDENNIDLRNYVGEARLINPEVAEMTRSLFIKHGMIPGSSQIESFLQSLI